MVVGIISKSREIMRMSGKELGEIILSSGHSVVFYEKNFIPDDFQCTVIEGDDFFEKSDIIIVLGGDGTLLKIAEKASKFNVPVLGINHGRIGLLTDMEKSEMNEVVKVLENKYTIDERMMIKAQVICDDKVIQEFTALNDIVISRGTTPKMLEISLYTDGELTTDIRADGVIIATPTGSTAYSLSAGGSVIDPAARLIAFTPICPHTLKSRPLIIAENRNVILKHKNQEVNSYLTCDGQEIITLDRKYDINISVSEHSLKLIRVKNRNFYSVLKEKL